MFTINIHRLKIIDGFKYAPLFINYESVENELVGEWIIYYNDGYYKILLKDNHIVQGSPFWINNEKEEYWLLEERKERINKHVMNLCGYEFEIVYLDNRIMCLSSWKGAPVICIKKEFADKFLNDDDIIGYLASRENDSKYCYLRNLEKITRMAPDFWVWYKEMLQMIGFILFCSFPLLAVKYESILSGLLIVVVAWFILSFMGYLFTFCGVKKWLKRLFLLYDYGGNPFFKPYRYWSEKDKAFYNKNKNHIDLDRNDYIVIQQEIESLLFLKIKSNISAWRKNALSNSF